MNQIPHLLRPDADETVLFALERRKRTLHRELRKAFNAQYALEAEEPKPIDDGKWTHEITVRDGNRIGMVVEMTWKSAKPKLVEFDIYKSTRTGMTLIYLILGAFFIAGAVFGFIGIPPLDFLAGTKIGTVIGGFIGLVPGGILALIVNGMMSGKFKEENLKLKEEVTAVVKKNFVDGILQFVGPEDGSAQKP